MTAPVRRRLVDDAFFAFLRDALSFPVGLAEVPQDPENLEAPLDTSDRGVRYAIVYPVPAGVGLATGPPAAPEADTDLDYDVRVVVGLDRGRQGCQWGADEVYRVLFTREEWGEPTNVLTIDGHAEMERSAPEGPGTAIFLDGVWQATVSVRLSVTRFEG